jgi:hypothetical protein
MTYTVHTVDTALAADGATGVAPASTPVPSIG